MLSEPLAGLFPDTHGKERPWRERPPGGLRAFPVFGVSRHPEGDTALLGRPLHGRGHRRATLSQVFKTQSRSQPLRCSSGGVVVAFTG